MSSDSAFANQLRALREKRELNQSDLARAAGLQPSAIAHFEGGRRKPSFDNIRELAKALGVTTDTLMGSATSTTAFRNEGNLSAADRDFIQKIIDMRVKEKEGQ